MDVNINFLIQTLEKKICLVFHTLHVSDLIKGHIFISIWCSRAKIHHLKTNITKIYQISSLKFVNKCCYKTEPFSYFYHIKYLIKIKPKCKLCANFHPVYVPTLYMWIILWYYIIVQCLRATCVFVICYQLFDNIIKFLKYLYVNHWRWFISFCFYTFFILVKTSENTFLKGKHGVVWVHVWKKSRKMNSFGSCDYCFTFFNLIDIIPCISPRLIKCLILYIYLLFTKRQQLSVIKYYKALSWSSTYHFSGHLFCLQKKN